jgi:HK97 family phage portal protein
MNRASALAYSYGSLKAKQSYPPHLLAMAGAEKYSLPDPSIYQNQADLYRRLSWTQSAVSISSETAALQAIRVKEMIGEETKDIPNHDFELLLMKANPDMSRFEFLQSTFGYRKLTGNSFWWLNKPRGEKAPPAEMWVIPPYKIQPIPDENLYLKGYWYYPGGGMSKVALETWEIVHFKAFNPINEFVGLSGVEAIAAIAETDLKKQDWALKLYGENNARMPGVMAFADPIGDQAWDKIKTDMVDASAKRNIMMLRGAGKGGVEWKQAANTLEEMEFNEGRKFTKEEIYAIFAPGLSSILDVNATEANSKAGKNTFTEFAIYPMLVSVQEKITQKILPLYGEKLKAEFDDPRQVDRALELQEQQVFNATHTIDEIRKEYYEDDPLGDDRGLLLPAQIAASPIPISVTTGEEPEISPQLQPQQEQLAQLQEVETEEPEKPDAEFKAVIGRWRRFSLNAFKKGRSPAIEFILDSPGDIGPGLYGDIREALKSAKDEAAIKAVFENVQPREPESELVAELRRANELLERRERRQRDDPV